MVLLGLGVLWKHFDENDATKLAADLGIETHRRNRPTERFAYFADSERFVIVAGAQEKKDVESAFARDLGLRENRRASQQQHR